jgi:hypothetical protein
VLQPWRAQEHSLYGGLGTTSKSRPAMAGVIDRALPPMTACGMCSQYCSGKILFGDAKNFTTFFWEAEIFEDLF